MKRVSVKYFAQLREEAGRDSETIEVSCETYGELYLALKTKYDFSLGLEAMQVARQDEFTTMEDSLSDGDLVVFLPPMAGG